MKRLTYIVFCLFVLGCSDDSKRSGSETHWLECGTAADCPGSQLCVLGACVSEEDAPDVAVADDGTPTNAPANNPALDVGAPDSGPMSPNDAGPGPTGEVFSASDDQLQFFGLPINSDRSAVSAYDSARDLCVSVIFDYSNTGRPRDHVYCDDEWGDSFPYVVIESGDAGPGGCWDYGANSTVVSATGCVDFALGASDPDRTDLADDIEVVVDSPLFAGTIVFDNTP